MGRLIVCALGLPVLLGACSVMFDAPQKNAANQEASARAMHDLNKIAEEEARAIQAEVERTDERRAGSKTQTLTSPDGKKTLALSFEKTNADMPQLVMRELGDANIRINGEVIEPGNARQERIVLIPPGRHDLVLEYAGSQPFSARFYIKKGERAILRAISAPVK
jgi:hypothetical protein